MIDLSTENFNELINSDYVLVDFYATWCGPCKMMHPILENIINHSIKVIKVDVDKFENIAKEYAILSIPTLVLIKNGEMIDKKIGYTPEPELIKWIDENR